MSARDLSINQRVASYRKLKGFNQTQMGEFLGIKTSTYSQKERKGNITAEEIIRIADILNMDVNVLLYGEKQPTKRQITVIKPKPQEIEQKIHREYISRYGFLENLTPKNISYLKIIFTLKPHQRKAVFDLAYKYYLENKKIH